MTPADITPAEVEELEQKAREHLEFMRKSGWAVAASVTLPAETILALVARVRELEAQLLVISAAVNHYNRDPGFVDDCEAHQALDKIAQKIAQTLGPPWPSAALADAERSDDGNR